MKLRELSSFSQKKTITAAITGVLVAMASGPALSAQLEEVLVTAQKRVEGLQDVPISVAAVSGDRLRSSGIVKMEDLSLYVPGLQINEATGTDSLFIRGLGSGINMGFEQSVGMVIDGVFYGRARYSRGQFLDLERVEVLKGPQGILFGKNTTSGMVNITTANPTNDFEGWVTVGYEVENEEKTFEGALSGPLTDTLSGRIAYRYNEVDKGWVENITTGEDNPTSEDWVARLSLQWDPSDAVNVMFKYQHADFEKTGRNTVLIKCSPAITGFLAGLGSAEGCKLGDERSNISPRLTDDPEIGEQQESDYDTYALTVNWDIGEHTITSVTGYSEYDYFDSFTSDHVPASVADADVSEEYNQFSQELRIASPVGETFEYIAGVFYQDTELDVLWNLYVDFPSNFGGGPAFSRLSNSHQESDMWAVFAQGTWNISESVALTLGARYSEESKEATTVMNLYPVPFDANPSVPGQLVHDVEGDRDEENFAPMLSVKWHANDDIMAYASISQGFKGGGYDLLSPFPQSSADDVFEFDKEEVLAYEVGVKMTLFDGAAELNVAVFRSEFDDLQVSALAPGGIINFFVANAAEAVSQGVELEGRWLATDRLLLSANIAFLDATFEDFPEAACYALQTIGCVDGVQDLSGADLQFAPELAANLHAEYTWPMGDSLEWLAAMDVNYTDEYSLASDGDPIMWQDSFTKVDARLTLRSDDATWEVALLGKNLTDEETTAWGSDAVNAGPFLGTYYVHLNRLRTLAIQGTYRF